MRVATVEVGAEAQGERKEGTVKMNKKVVEDSRSFVVVKYSERGVLVVVQKDVEEGPSDEEGYANS